MDSVTVTAPDLRALARTVSRLRRDCPDIQIHVEIGVVIAEDLSVARSNARNSQTADPSESIRYVGTPAGLAGLLRDIHTLELADGVVIKPLISTPTHRDFVPTNVLTALREQLPSLRIRFADDAEGSEPELATPTEAAFSIAGTVIHGDRRGRQIGFPTANIPVDEATLDGATNLRDGVYVTWFERGDGTCLLSTTSVGHRPTFYGKDAERLIEVHILDFTGDLYDESVTVHFMHRLRPQRAFDGVDALVTQLANDVQQTREWARQAVA